MKRALVVLDSSSEEDSQEKIKNPKKKYKEEEIIVLPKKQYINDPKIKAFSPIPLDELDNVRQLKRFGYLPYKPIQNESNVFYGQLDDITYFPPIFNPMKDSFYGIESTSKKPQIIQTQNISQEFCPWAAFCNLFQKKVDSFASYRSKYQKLLYKYSNYFHLNAESKERFNEEMKHIIRGDDIAGAVNETSQSLILYEGGYFMRAAMMNFERAKPDIINGIVGFSHNNGQYSHSIAIRNGWAVDSFGYVYKWNGYIEGGMYIYPKIVTAFEIQLKK